MNQFDNPIYREEFDGKPARLEFKPTQRSRKWQRSSLTVQAYSDGVHLPLAKQLATQENWFVTRWVDANG